MLRLGWFSTGGGEGSRGFLNLIQGQIETGSLDARIEFVFCNRERGEAEGSDQFFDLVEGYRLPLITLSSRRYRRENGGGSMRKHRDGFHAAVTRLISDYRPDICVLAGYMLITSPEMCRSLPMINLHPALPGGPAGTWQEVIWKLIEQRAVESGVMAHVATEVVDTGPVLAYCTFPIRGEAFDPLWQVAEGLSKEQLKAQGEDQPLLRLIRLEGMRRERPLLLETLRAVAGGRLNVSNGHVHDAGGAPVTGGQCLDEEVERLLEASEG
jgi:folate-dependent phosphoribosylglycinamide formyltransferase PurN